MSDMDDMNAPEPPMDTDMNDMPMDGPNPMGGENQYQMGGDTGEDPLAGDPNALNAGTSNGPEGYDQLSNKGKAAVDAYTKSIADEENGTQEESPMNGQMQPPMGESRNIIKKVIDEVFSTIMDDNQEGTERPQKELEDNIKHDFNSPYVPYN